MAITVINHTGTTKHVPIVGPAGATDEIHVQPKGKVTLLEGWSVAASYRSAGVDARDPTANQVVAPPTPKAPATPSK